MNGSKVRKWIDRWIPFIPSSRSSPMGLVQVSRYTRVDYLIYPANGEWDIEFLKPFVSDKEYEAILETYIGDPLFLDRLMWPFDKKGIFSVKSRYHWAYSRKLAHWNLRFSSSASIPSSFWNMV